MPKLTSPLRWLNRWFSGDTEKSSLTKLRGELSVKEWRALGPNADFREVAPASEGDLPQPLYHYPALSLETKEWRKGCYKLPPLFTLELPKGRTVKNHGDVITQDHYLLSDFSRRFVTSQAPSQLVSLSATSSRRQGRYALLSGPGHSTYHWLFDNMGRAAVLKAAGYTDFDGYFLRKPKYPAHYEILSLMGIPEEKVIWCTSSSDYEAEQLVVPSYANNGREVHPLALDYLKSLMPPPPEGPRRRLYLSRKDASKGARRVGNEADIEALLGEYGFESVTLSGLSLIAQMHLFASAELMVAPHGGGLSNLCFCDSPLHVIELFLPQAAPTYYRSLAHQCGFSYEALSGETDAEADVIMIDTNKLRVLVEAALSELRLTA